MTRNLLSETLETQWFPEKCGLFLVFILFKR